MRNLKDAHLKHKILMFARLALSCLASFQVSKIIGYMRFDWMQTAALHYDIYQASALVDADDEVVRCFIVIFQFFQIFSTKKEIKFELLHASKG